MNGLIQVRWPLLASLTSSLGGQYNSSTIPASGPIVVIGDIYE